MDKKISFLGVLFILIWIVATFVLILPKLGFLRLLLLLFLLLFTGQLSSLLNKVRKVDLKHRKVKVFINDQHFGVYFSTVESVSEFVRKVLPYFRASGSGTGMPEGSIHFMLYSEFWKEPIMIFSHTRALEFLGAEELPDGGVKIQGRELSND